MWIFDSSDGMPPFFILRAVCPLGCTWKNAVFEFVYKKEVRGIRAEVKKRSAKGGKEAAEAAAWGKAEEALLAQRYERELMNPKEALSLGSISSIVMPSDLRKEIAQNLEFHLSHYKPAPMSGIQREFFWGNYCGP